MSNQDNSVNQTTKKMIDFLKKVAADNSVGGGFEEEGSFRALAEPTENDNTAAGFIKTFNRDELETAWQQSYKDETKSVHASMKLAIQNDFICQAHRDLQHRYSGRIGRMLHENARKENHKSEPNGIIQAIQSRIQNFMNLNEPKED